MFNELIIARRITHIGEPAPQMHGADTDHHSAEDWRAFYHALTHRSVFERRIHR